MTEDRLIWPISAQIMQQHPNVMVRLMERVVRLESENEALKQEGVDVSG